MNTAKARIDQGVFTVILTGILSYIVPLPASWPGDSEPYGVQFRRKTGKEKYPNHEWLRYFSW